jgi:hypothetical protein
MIFIDSVLEAAVRGNRLVVVASHAAVSTLAWINLLIGAVTFIQRFGSALNLKVIGDSPQFSKNLFPLLERSGLFSKK